MRHFSLGNLAIATLGLALSAAGCESMSGNNGGGKVTDRDQKQQTGADGTQVRERTQVRQMPDGQTVKETETQKREPVAPGADASTPAK